VTALLLATLVACSPTGKDTATAAHPPDGFAAPTSRSPYSTAASSSQACSAATASSLRSHREPVGRTPREPEHGRAELERQEQPAVRRARLGQTFWGSGCEPHEGEHPLRRGERGESKPRADEQAEPRQKTTDDEVQAHESSLVTRSPPTYVRSA
jgi:hypothetical protein